MRAIGSDPRLALSASAIEAFELGRRDIRIGELIRWCDALDVHLADVLEEALQSVAGASPTITVTTRRLEQGAATQEPLISPIWTAIRTALG